MQLSPHFTLAEMTRSALAARHGITNKPGPAEVVALRVLCTNVLEPIRAQFAAPVVITSGFRSPGLNRRAGGRPNSQHQHGEAADLEVIGHSNRDVWSWCRGALEFDQLILEFHDERDPASGWVHVSYCAGRRNRREAFIIRA